MKRTALLFLHGVGNSSDDKPWRDGLNVGLRNHGYQGLDAVDVLEPDYRDLLELNGWPRQTMPPQSDLSETRQHAARGSYELGRASLRRLLVNSALDPDAKWPDPGALLEPAMHIADFKQATRYVRSKLLRAHVLTRVLNHLPWGDLELVVVGHSLGSIVAFDLLGYLPERVTVRRLVTIGSPGGLEKLQGTREEGLFPYTQVRSWLNVLSPFDLVTGGRGLAWRYPAAQDVQERLGPAQHAAYHYLASPAVAQAVGEALFGSRENALAVPARSLDRRPTDIEATCLFGLAYVHKVLGRLKKEEPKIARRYEQALTIVQNQIAQRLQAASDDGRTVPSAVAELTTGAAPAVPQTWANSPDHVVQVLIITATTNLIAPYLVDDEGAHEHVLETVAEGMGSTRTVGRHVRDALDEARRGLKRTRWHLFALAGFGLGLLALGPIGIAAGSAAGAAGAAALTSGLAAFGPGGMVGGLALAGTLAGAGGAVTATSLGQVLSAEGLEVEVHRRMAHALACKKLKHPKTLDDWIVLSELESTVSAELASHSSISDDDSAVVKDLTKRRVLLRRALDWMTEHELGPAQPDAAVPGEFVTLPNR